MFKCCRKESLASETAGEKRDLRQSKVYQTRRKIESLRIDLGNEQSRQLQWRERKDGHLCR